jgi:hypothetical protein
MSNRDIVLRLARAVAPDAVVSVPAAWLLDALGESDPKEADAPMKDLDAHDLATHYGRSVKTIRAWLAAGVFEQAYRTPAGWRVPRGALRHVRQKQPQGNARSTAPGAQNLDAVLRHR